MLSALSYTYPFPLAVPHSLLPAFAVIKRFASSYPNVRLYPESVTSVIPVTLLALSTVYL